MLNPPPPGLGDLEKFRSPVRSSKRAKNGKKWIFSVFGAVLGDTPADQICLRAKCGPSELCLGSHVSLGLRIWPFWGGWGSFLQSGTQPTKNCFGCNSAPPASFRECFGSLGPRLRCATSLP